MKLLRLGGSALLLVCLATVLAEAAGLAALWARGALSQEKLLQLAAVAQGVDLAALARTLEAAAQPVSREGFSLEELARARTLVALDLDLRDMACDKGLEETVRFAAHIESQRDRYATLKLAFDKRLEQIREGIFDPSLREVQRQLEAITPSLAKDQIVRLLDDRNLDREAAMQFVVTLLKAMSLDKRKRILAEFKSEETERLHAMLREVRRGVPEVTLIRQTRQQLQELEARETPAGKSPRPAAPLSLR